MLDVAHISCQKGFNILFSRVSFYLNTGEIGRVIGVNGTGKTSLLKILAGISSFTGKVTLDGEILGGEIYQQRTLYLGHQSLVNHQLTTLENLVFLHCLIDYEVTISDQQYINALTRVGLGAYIHQRTYTLSAGQKRRIILAVLFITRTTFWLLDEPFNALDTDMITLLEQRIREFCNTGGICIFTTHQATTLNAIQITL